MKRKIFIRKAPIFLPAFTLPEVLISLFVVSFGILVVVRFFAVSLVHMVDSRSQIIADGLVQEGLEIVRNVRDSNNFSNLEYYDSFPNASGKECSFFYNKSRKDILDCSGNVNRFKVYLDANGMYSHDSSGTVSQFRRRISFGYYNGDSAVANANQSDRVKVTCQVIWKRTDFPADCTPQNNCLQAEEILTSAS